MLQLRHVKKSYVEPDGGALPILDIPHFEVRDAEQMVLVGKSGCGKTTLLHTISGITRADAGEIVIDGVDITKLSEAGVDKVRAAKIGYVFQTFNLLPGFTALENVLLGMTFARGRKDPQRARQLLERVGLGHRLTHRPTALSVGEQQRVAVARSLANRPSLLLADEPTANIDQRNQQKIVDLIRDTCREEQVALVMVTHSLDVANQFERVDKLEEINQVTAVAAAAAGS
jgi:putative ABC transport system ATP-binding protein